MFHLIVFLFQLTFPSLDKRTQNEVHPPTEEDGVSSISNDRNDDIKQLREEIAETKREMMAEVKRALAEMHEKYAK